MRDDPVVTALLTRAANGEGQAWDALVERYAPLIWAICRSHRLGDADAGDVGQRVWLQVVDHLDNVRDPAALPGWLATTTRRECARVQRAAHRAHAAGHPPDAQITPDHPAQPVEQQLLAGERHPALREAFARLPPRCQQLITLLIQDPPLPYATISARLNIPVGSIGLNRDRCLDKLRRDPAITALISAAPAQNRPAATTTNSRRRTIPTPACCRAPSSWSSTAGETWPGSGLAATATSRRAAPDA